MVANRRVLNLRALRVLGGSISRSTEECAIANRVLATLDWLYHPITFGEEAAAHRLLPGDQERRSSEFPNQSIRNMLIRYKTHLLIAGMLMVVIALAAWRYLESDSPPARPLREASSHIAVGNTMASPESIEDISNSSVSHNPAAYIGLPAATPLSLKDALALASRFERHQQLERFGFDAAKEGTEPALQRLAEITNAADRAAFLRGMFTHLADNPGEALRAVKSLDAVIDRETAVAALVANWRPEPLPLDEQASLIRRYGSVGGMLASLLGNPVLTADCARELLSGMERARVLGSASGRLAATDPQQALALGSQLEGRERTEFLLCLAASWTRTDGDAAWAWAQQQTDPALRNSLQETILANWAARDPAAAALVVPQITNAESRQKLLEAVAGSWANADTKAAFDWANNLSTPQERDAATAAIRENAPVGIGVVLADGPDGYPLIRELVPGSTASSSGLLQSGYQIAAVGDGNGRFTDLLGKNMEDVVPLIRGKPGSSVWLQVIRPGGTPANRLTVVVPRKQLMFKNPPAP
jgi:hypothetical protein